MRLSILQSRRLSRSIRLVAAAVALAWVASVLALAWYERDEALQTSRQRLELLARVLEDHATRSVESADLVLRTLDDSVRLLPQLDAPLLQPLLSQALLAQPVLRGVAVLDPQGQVLASSDAHEAGLHIPLSAFGPPPPAGHEWPLRWQAGRNLRTLGATTLGTSVGVLPLIRHAVGPGGQPLLLVALINPDALANYQQTALGKDEGERAALATYAGQLLAGTQGVSHAPSDLLRAHPVFDALLQTQEHGSYLGEGLGEGPQVVAFRTSRSRPLVVLVEQDESAALQVWRNGLWLPAAVGLLVLAAIIGATQALLRALHVRERARSAMDRAHEQVALREREMSVLLKSVQELIFRTDAQGRLTFVNARWEVINREAADGKLGWRLQDLVEPHDRDRVAALFASDDRAGVRSAEVSLRTGEGRLRHVQIAVAPLQGQGHTMGFAGSAMDITERREAEQRLQRQLGFTELLLEVSPQPIAMVDANGHYVSVNRAWEEFTGRPRHKVLGRPAVSFMPAAERAVHDEKEAQLRERGGRLSYEARLLGRDGRQRDMLVTKVAVPDVEGNGIGILSTLTDVSDFRAAERATREARDAAEEASRAKSEFIANISHELRTPLQSILGFSELGAVRGRERPKLAAMFGDIHASGQRMLALVNDLLDVSKIESAVGTFNLERCELRQLIELVVQELDPLLARRSLALQCRLPAGLLIAKVDPLRFQQVIRNVVANAIKFSPEGGVIELDAGRTPDQEIHIRVADRGPGIPPAELEQIFEAFVQSSSTKDGSGGTGLGLAICRKIIEIHGGRIRAENRAGGGACFHIVLPSRPPGDTQLDIAM